MTEPVATLIVDDGPRRLLMVGMTDTIRIDGLPTVWDCGTPYQPAPPVARPLRVDDRVFLATPGHNLRDGRPGPQGVIGWQSVTTFATATVAEIDGPAWDGTPGEFHYLVTVTDVEELS